MKSTNCNQKACCSYWQHITRILSANTLPWGYWLHVIITIKRNIKESYIWLILLTLITMLWVSQLVNDCRPGVSGNSRSRSFPRMKASDSHSRTLGMDFFIPFPFPNFGNVFFHSHPVPEFWEWFFSFPSFYWIVGMDFFHSLPIPKFAISQMGIKTGIGLGKLSKTFKRYPLNGQSFWQKTLSGQGGTPPP